MRRGYDRSFPIHQNFNTLNKSLDIRQYKSSSLSSSSFLHEQQLADSQSPRTSLLLCTHPATQLPFFELSQPRTQSLLAFSPITQSRAPVQPDREILLESTARIRTSTTSLQDPKIESRLLIILFPSPPYRRVHTETTLTQRKVAGVLRKSSRPQCLQRRTSPWRNLQRLRMVRRQLRRQRQQRLPKLPRPQRHQRPQPQPQLQRRPHYKLLLLHAH